MTETQSIERRVGRAPSVDAIGIGEAGLQGDVVTTVEVVEEVETRTLTDDTNVRSSQPNVCRMIELGDVVAEQPHPSRARSDLAGDRRDKGRLTRSARAT